MSLEPVSDCTPEKCERCDIPPHAKHLCQAFTEWKRQVGELHRSEHPGARALAHKEVFGLFAVSITHALQAGYVVFNGDVLGLLDRITEIVVAVVTEMDPKHVKNLTAELDAALLGGIKGKGPLTTVKVH